MASNAAYQVVSDKYMREGEERQAFPLLSFLSQHATMLVLS